jgi:molybdenum cofactor cytidylyltransferase
MGEWKLLLPFRGSTIVQRVVEAALEACARVILVTGWRAEELEQVFAGEPRVVPVRNPRWEAGMFGSQQAGIARVRSRRFFVTPADMPLLSPAVYAALLDASPADAVFPVFGGRRGHPVLFSSATIPAVLAADPATGRLKDIARGLDCAEVQWTDDSILRDIDNRQDYEEVTR